MMRPLTIVTLCFLLQGADQCYGAQNIMYINPGTGSGATTVDGYAKKDTTLKWNVLNAGDSYTIHFFGTPPCRPSQDPKALSAYTKHPATCQIILPRGYKKGRFLHYSYTVDDNNKAGHGTQEFYQHVGSCDTCIYNPAPTGDGAADAKAIGALLPKIASSSKTYIETLSCAPPPPSISPDASLTVVPGDDVYWNNPNGASKPSFKIEFDRPAPCTDAVTFDSPECLVTKAPGTYTYTYDVTVGSGQAPKGCKLHGSLTVSASTK
jgi:hypothetical protein